MEEITLLEMLYRYTTPLNVAFYFILIIGGKAWSNHFSVFKNKTYNFLFFAFISGAAWMGLKALDTNSITRTDFEGLFVTLLLAMVSYNVVAKAVLKRIENFFTKKAYKDETPVDNNRSRTDTE